MPPDITSKLDEVDQQIFDLLEQRVGLCQQAMEEGDDAEEQLNNYEGEGLWEEAADERGLNVTRMGRIHKEIVALAKESEV